MLAEIIEMVGGGWSLYDDFGDESLLECPCGHAIEQDGTCPNGHASPLRGLGLV